MTFTVKEGSFCFDDKKVFLTSGEIHYFRIKRELWEKHLAEAREAGLTTVSTYVPWAWHEPEEGKFDFDGSTCPERDLEGWLQLCNEYGLHAIVKPGPFILAEFRGAGLPAWFFDKQGATVKMHNSKGEPVASDGVSLFNPQYLEKVTRWYDRVMPIISRQQITVGGPVIMMQVCNEIGVFSWLAHQADYSEGVLAKFIAYLQKKFSSIDELNSLWGTGYGNFQDIELPPDGRLPYTSKGDRGRDYEWHMFWRFYYADYLKMLTAMARERGVTVPVYHNLPGWIYGSGYEFPVNITMYDELFGDKSDIVFAVDHIPEFMSYRNMHDDRIINDITRAMQGDKPLFAAEFQSGSREYHVVTNPREMELFYKASIANGLTGWNYYMFSQGRNTPRTGYSGSTFYWFNPLTPEGERTSAYPLVQRTNRLIRTAENLMVNAQRRAKVCVLFYPPYYATELERPENGSSGLLFNASSIRRPAYFDGLLRALQVLNIDYDMADLTKVTGHDLSKYTQVWAFATDEMNARDQQAIADYTSQGGNTVIFPCLPDREMSQKPCSVLRDALNIRTAGTEVIDSPLIDILGFADIKCANPQVIYDENALQDAEIIARTLTGNACGFSKALGKGNLTHLGTWLGFDTEGHKPVYEALLNRPGTRLRNAACSNENIAVRQRFTEEGSGLLFIGNYFNEEHTGPVTYSHPATGEPITVPFSGKEILWPALYSVLSPVSMPVADGLKILHSTSDILNIKSESKKLKISLYGDRDLAGELVFEGENAVNIISALSEDAPLPLKHSNGRVVVEYTHPHRSEIEIKIVFDED